MNRPSSLLAKLGSGISRFFRRKNPVAQARLEKLATHAAAGATRKPSTATENRLARFAEAVRKAPPAEREIIQEIEEEITGRRGVALGSLTNPDKLAEFWEAMGMAPPRQEMLTSGEVRAFLYEGMFLHVHSSNVEGAYYEPATEEMTVGFLNGSTYVYSKVTLREALSFAQAQSKGIWVWDNLRIRGTVKGHRKPYRRVS